MTVVGEQEGMQYTSPFHTHTVEVSIASCIGVQEHGDGLTLESGYLPHNFHIYDRNDSRNDDGSQRR